LVPLDKEVEKKFQKNLDWCGDIKRQELNALAFML
jgi:hypothetical protein